MCLKNRLSIIVLLLLLPIISYYYQSMEGPIMANRICVVGNISNNPSVADGGRVKIRLYIELLKREGFTVSTIDLDNWKIKLFSILIKIKREIFLSDSIVIMAGPKGCRYLIPLINRMNKKNAKRIVFCALGIGALDSVISKLNIHDVNDFINHRNFFDLSDKKMRDELCLLDSIILENDLLKETYEIFYNLNNCEVIPNFRDVEISNRLTYDLSSLNICFLSRVAKAKGVLDLMRVVSNINSTLKSNQIKLSIYGQKELSFEELNEFNAILDDNILYHGVAKKDEVITILSNHNLFCLPTQYYGEGMPGSLIEAMMAGTPPLISSFSQASTIITDGYNGLVFKIGDATDLKNKILYCQSNLNSLEKIGRITQNYASRFTYKFNRDKFLQKLAGMQ